MAVASENADVVLRGKAVQQAFLAVWAAVIHAVAAVKYVNKRHDASN